MICVPTEPTVNEVIDPVKAIENYKRENKYLKEELALHDTLDIYPLKSFFFIMMGKLRIIRSLILTY